METDNTGIDKKIQEENTGNVPSGSKELNPIVSQTLSQEAKVSKKSGVPQNPSVTEDNKKKSVTERPTAINTTDVKEEQNKTDNLDYRKLSIKFKSENEKIGDAHRETVTGTGTGSILNELVNKTVDSGKRSFVGTERKDSREKPLSNESSDKKVKTSVRLSEETHGSKTFDEKVNVTGRKSTNGKISEIEIKVHDLSQGFSSMEADLLGNEILSEQTGEEQSDDFLVEPEEFMNPFKCVVKTSSLMLLDENAKIGVIKKQLPIMTMNEVVIHNKPNDCWVIIFGVVRDLTPLIKEYKANKKYKLVKPIVAHAGKDISHWFNDKTNDILHFVHPITGVVVPYTPHGRIPDVGLQVPSTKWQPQIKKPWWEDSKYIIGLMTKCTRPVRILNVSSRCEVLLHVCCEDTINRIQERYLPFNKHAQSYTWKYDRRVLDMNLTLDENGIKDDRKLFSSIGLSDTSYVPCLMLYFNDDLTEL